MARGEQDGNEQLRDRGVGLAIGASLAAATLAALLLLVWTGTERTAPSPAPFSHEAFPGANAALQTLGWRDRVADPPDAPVPSTPDDAALRLHQELVARGYQPMDDWSQPAPLPLTATLGASEEGCGVVVAAATLGGHLSDGSVEGERPMPSATPLAMSIGGCGDAAVRFFGTGEVLTRRYQMPGLTAAALRRLALPVEVALAHAEAEALLAKVGWQASPELVAESLAPATGPRAIAAPKAPSTGCVPWVAVGLGLGRASVTWNGIRVVEDLTEGRFLAGLVRCGGPEAASSVLEVVGDGEHEGRLWLRAYEARSGPRTPAPQATTLGAAVIRSPADATLPPPTRHD